ncbi:MAG: glycosyltransferase [Lachnospiraceae bacterium]|nr:glycosyltransferase [Lachnospiraceae bacterium]
MTYNIYPELKKYFGGLREFVPESLRMKLKEKAVADAMRGAGSGEERYICADYPRGFNLIGPIHAEMGLGQSCRLVAHQLEMSRYPFSVYNVGFDGKLRANDVSYNRFLSEELIYNVNLFHVNPYEAGNLFMEKPELWKGRYNIAYWLWELEEFPEEWVNRCTLFDEIWTPSEFTAGSIRKKAGIPVRTLPYSVSASCADGCSREDFGLPERMFLYLVMYDVNSTSGRKNPQGAIEAYKKAFPKEEKDCGIIIKINNSRPEDVRKLRKLLADYQNVFFLEETMEKDRVNSLIRCADVYVSLHRAEGFGLVMAEAMLLGTPVVATNWSSNTEFMSEDAACMVKYELVKNPKAEGLYPKGCVWAEPDVSDAAVYMRRLRQDTGFYQLKARKGREYINECLGKDRICALWEEQMEQTMKLASQITEKCHKTE